MNVCQRNLHEWFSLKPIYSVAMDMTAKQFHAKYQQFSVANRQSA